MTTWQPNAWFAGKKTTQKWKCSRPLGYWTWRLPVKFPFEQYVKAEQAFVFSERSFASITSYNTTPVPRSSERLVRSSIQLVSHSTSSSDLRTQSAQPIAESPWNPSPKSRPITATMVFTYRGREPIASRYRIRLWPLRPIAERVAQFWGVHIIYILSKVLRYWSCISR